MRTSTGPTSSSSSAPTWLTAIPILFLRMMERVKAGAKLIVVDPRRTATADKADLFLQISPGTDLALLNGLLHLIVENGHTDDDFIAEFTEGWEVMPSFLRAVHPRSRQRNHGHTSRRHPHRGALDRRSRELDEHLDDGAQPEHPRHLEHQRDLQPAPGHRRDLQARQRSLLAHRTAQRDGRTRNGLHGARSAGSTVGDLCGGSRIRRGAVGYPSRFAAHRCQRRRDRHVLPHGRRSDQGVLDHLHQSRCHRG